MYLHTADSLSRSPLHKEGNSRLTELVELRSHGYLCHPSTCRPTETQWVWERPEFRSCLLLIIKYCRNGWPSKSHVNKPITPYWVARGDLTLQGDLLLHGICIFVPASKQHETLEKKHRNPEEQTPSPEVSMEVQSSGADRNDSENRPTLHKGKYPMEGAIHTLRSPRLSLAEEWVWSLCPQREDYITILINNNWW